MKEIVVLSGKGGCGKTTVTGSLAVLAEKAVLADCDVDAADLSLLLNGEIIVETPFFSGLEPVFSSDLCTQCGRCLELCRFGALSFKEGEVVLDPLACEGCGVCADHCPQGAITTQEAECGVWFRSETAFGPLVHAELGPGGENSGKLVTLVRRTARELAQEAGARIILTDGPPGIGCPVIASLTGADEALIIIEPSLSGLHDLKRLLQLTEHFRVPSRIWINKFDINPDLTEQIEELGREKTSFPLGRIPYDPLVLKAVKAGIPPQPTPIHRRRRPSSASGKKLNRQ